MNYASGLSVLIMLVSFGSSKGFAGSCETKDLNASKNSPFRQIPVYDQDGSGTCYAHAAVQLVDYYRINKGESKVEVAPGISEDQ